MPRILITRSPHQASDLADRLRDHGLEPILIPTISLEDPTSFAALDSAISTFSTFDWLLFTSANAVKAFFKRADTMGAAFIAESHVAMSGKAQFPRIATIGLATAHSIEKLFNRKPDLIPPQAVAESFAQALLPYARQGTRFLLVRAESARDVLTETLRAAGAEVTIAVAYRNVIPPESAAHLKALFADRATWPDAITFTSSSTASNLFDVLASTRFTLPPEILRASIGPITSQTLRDLGYPPQLEALEPTIPALVEILVKTLNLSKSS